MDIKNSGKGGEGGGKSLTILNTGFTKKKIKKKTGKGERKKNSFKIKKGRELAARAWM